MPSHALLWQREDTTPYECDGLTAYRARPLAVTQPETLAQVQAVSTFVRLFASSPWQCRLRNALKQRVSCFRNAHKLLMATTDVGMHLLGEPPISSFDLG